MWLAGFETHRAIAFVWKNKNLDLSYQRGSVEVVFKTDRSRTFYRRILWSPSHVVDGGGANGIDHEQLVSTNDSI